MKKIFGLVLGLFFLVSNAQALDLGVGVKAGSVGAGVDLSLALTKTVNARLTLANIDESTDESIEIDDANNSANIDAELDLGFGATGLLFDWYIFNGKFHFTAGLMRNDSAIDLDGTITDANVIFDGTSYNVAADFTDPSIGGSISAGESFEPYLGIGWGRKAGRDVGFDFTVELGVMLMDPEVDLTAPTHTNPASQAALDSDVEAAESSANDDISEFDAWPVFTIGLNYAF